MHRDAAIKSIAIACFLSNIAYSPNCAGLPLYAGAMKDLTQLRGTAK